jgi:hypothetical protein
MATTELTALPDSFPAGTTCRFRKAYSDYPASDGWALVFYLAGASVAQIEAEADGDAFVITITPEKTTGGFLAGHYHWEERVAKDGEVYKVDSGVVTIDADLATAAAGSLQSWLETSITVLKAHIASRLPAGMQMYAIHGRQVSKIPIAEAIGLLRELESELAALAHPDCISRTVKISFTNP